MNCLRVLSLLFLISSFATAAELPTLRVRAQTIDAAIQIGYGLAVADVDGDGKDDVLLADARQIVWYRAPRWEKFVMAENLTPKDNVCIAARDLDGDRKAEVAVGAEWNPNDTLKSGAIFLLEAPADRTQRWTAKKLPHEPTTHRMHWVRGSGGKPYLAVLPLHGRGNKNGAGAGVELHGYEWPWGDRSVPVPMMPSQPPLHLTHNFDLAPGRGGASGEILFVAAKEGVRLIENSDNRSVPQLITTMAAGEVRRGTLPGGGMFITTIEPMHGTDLAVYRGPNSQYSSGADWSAGRVLLEDKLAQGHGLATGDLLGIGSDQIVVGWRGTKPGDKVGVALFAPVDRQGASWRRHALVDDNGMACEDLRIADLNGDGRPDIVAAGRATKNVVIYWNETPGTAKRRSK